MEHKLTRQLESEICKYTGAQYAHMVTSATAGLHIAAMIAGIKPGTKFAASAYTQAATVNGAISLGGIPTFVDISFPSCTIDFDQIHDDCEVVFVTSINGRLSMDAAEQITRLRSRGVTVIEDAAQSLGSFHDGQHVGTFGDMGVFSFGAPKIITTGQGGCIITNYSDVSKQILAIKNFGRTVSYGEIYNTMGLNYKFTDLQAAFGLGQMERLPEIVEHKKQIYQWYNDQLIHDTVFLYTDLSDTAPVYPEIIVDNPMAVMAELKGNNIGYRQAYNCLADQPFHQQYADADNPLHFTRHIAAGGIHLPSQHSLTHEDVIFISNVVKKGLDNAR
jgi:perosamine synthetase